jgi:hypothetical protein
MGFALLLTGVGFGIVSIRVLKRRETDPVTDRVAPRTAVAAH